MAQDAKQRAMFASDCPRCGQSRTTFDVVAATAAGEDESYDLYEAFLRCRRCFRCSIGLLKATSFTQGVPDGLSGQYINSLFDLKDWVFEVPGRRATPEYVPEEIARIFKEGGSCEAIQAWDAAGAMYRKVLDVATRSITPKPDSSVEPRPSSWKTYKDLRLRLDWLFENKLLNQGLKDLSSCIHEDGNDAAHDIAGITKAEAQDMADFTENVLEALYTLPGQIAENRKRRDIRRGVAVE